MHAAMTQSTSQLVAAYRLIYEQRVAGLPICNARLLIDAVGFCDWENRYVGILITPWFMNLVVLPTGAENWQHAPTGSKVELELPSGPCRFDTCDLPGVGPHLSLALFSAVGDFPDHDTARQVATETLRRLFEKPDPDAVPAERATPSLSRRGLLSVR
jgi:[NiFe] hydrogenase assembly HybE family chaperone